jgi:hypothetical protein
MVQEAILSGAVADEERKGAEDYSRLRPLAGRQKVSDPPSVAEVVKMEQKGQVKTEQTKGELAEILVELIRTNSKVISAIYDCVCRCPNVVVEY